MAVLTLRGRDTLAEGECYYPSKQRRALDRLEFVKIARQSEPQQTYGDLEAMISPKTTSLVRIKL